MQTFREKRNERAADLNDCRALVRRITRSTAFAKSERLSSLLVYICDVTFQGNSKDLNEQNIGTAVFGRPPDYDCSIDGIVRTQASRLRARLDRYFQNEGVDEPLQIVIPRGGYVPFFEARLPARLVETQMPQVGGATAVENESSDLKSERAPVASSATSTSPRIGAFMPWAIVGSLIATIVVFTLLRHTNVSTLVDRQQSADLLWSTMFSRGKSTLLIYGDSGLVMWHGSSNRSLGLTEYLTGKYRGSDDSTASLLSPSDLSSRRYTSIVDMEVVHALDRIAADREANLTIRFARDARPNDLKEADVILVGASEANPWVGLFEPRMNFIFLNDRTNQIMSVMNRSPHPGEPERWDSDYKDSEHKVFGVVAYLQNFNGNGNVLLLEGTSMAGTESAWDFVSDDRQFGAFLTQLNVKSRQLPHFEAVLGTNNFGGSATKISVLAWRRFD